MAKCGTDSAQVRAGLESLGYALYAQSKFSGSLAQLRLALEEKPNRISSSKLAASLLATCPDSSLRSGAEAIALADKASRSIDGGDAAVLDTLSAAYAEDGKSAQAIGIEHRAVALPRNGERTRSETRLETH